MSGLKLFIWPTSSAFLASSISWSCRICCPMSSSIATSSSSSSCDRSSNCSSALLTTPSCFQLSGSRDIVRDLSFVSLKGVPHQVVLVFRSTVLVDSAVETDEHSTCLAVEVKLHAFKLGAVQGHLLWWD